MVRLDDRNATSGYALKVKMEKEVTDKKAVTESGEVESGLIFLK